MLHSLDWRWPLSLQANIAQSFHRQGCFAIDFDFATHRCYFFLKNYGIGVDVLPLFIHCITETGVPQPSSIGLRPHPTVVHVTLCEWLIAQTKLNSVGLLIGVTLAQETCSLQETCILSFSPKQQVVTLPSLSVIYLSLRDKHAALITQVSSPSLPNQPSIWVCPLWNALLLTCILMWLITVSVSGRPSGTDVSQTNYTLSNLSSAIVIWVVLVVRMLSSSGGSASVILALPIHICWIDKINQNALTVTLR